MFVTHRKECLSVCGMLVYISKASSSYKFTGEYFTPHYRSGHSVAQCARKSSPNLTSILTIRAISSCWWSLILALLRCAFHWTHPWIFPERSSLLCSSHSCPVVPIIIGNLYTLSTKSFSKYNIVNIGVHRWQSWRTLATSAGSGSYLRVSPEMAADQTPGSGRESSFKFYLVAVKNHQL